MSIEDHTENHPLRLFDNHPKGGMPKSELSMLMARSGVGKSTALMNFGLDTLRRGEHVLHFVVGMTSEKVHQYYKEIDIDFVHYYHEEKTAVRWDELNAHLTVISYLDPNKMANDIENEIQTILANSTIQPTLILVDGLDFDDSIAGNLGHLSEACKKFEVKMMASMTVHRDAATGAVPLDKVLSVCEKYSRAIYFMDPCKDDIRFERLGEGDPIQLPIYFNPTEMIFCKR